MRYLILLIFLIPSAHAKELTWHCGTLKLRWQEIPGKTEPAFQVKGCWQEKTLGLRSDSCKDQDSCLKRGKRKEMAHPGGGIGSPGFVYCYRAGGKPRFVQAEIEGKWENTSACFFGGPGHFLDLETVLRRSLEKNQEKSP